MIDIASKVFPNAAIRDEPKIHTGRVAEEEKATEQTTNNVRRNFRKHKGEEERGDILIRGLYANGTDCIIDVRVTDLDAKCDRNMEPEKVLQKHEREKKKKYLQACLAQRQHFAPFVVSTDGMLSKESKTLLKKLSSLLADKWEKPYHEVCGYVTALMSIAIVRATHQCIRGSRVPTAHMSKRLPQWEDKAGLSLFRR